jgi:phthalate 4,5-dioxygenase
MLSAADNQYLTRVDGDAPMGVMLRNNYWFPAILSCRLLPDGAPRRVRLLGRNFVAFRSTDGRVGVFNEACPHRGVSLVLARNEDNALRCVFHGWKYGVDGTVLEVPTEPRNQKELCKRVPLRHYAVREGAGIVWVWIGDAAPERFPDFEFMSVPDDQVYAVQQTLKCNWVQDVEGGLDSAHVGILHSTWLKALAIPGAGVDTAPIYEFQDQSSGYQYAAIRKTASGGRYIRVNRFVMPWYAFICPEEIPEGDRLVIFSTPIDDYNTTHWMLRYNRVRPLKPSFMNPVEDRSNFPPLPPGDSENAWGQNRQAMADGHFSGFSHVNTEDFAVAQSQGQILDRATEYLNEGDRAVVMMRRQLLDTARAYESGAPMPLAEHKSIPYPQLRADALELPAGEPWQSHLSV